MDKQLEIRIDELVYKSFEGMISEQECRELETILESDPQAREYYSFSVDFNIGLLRMKRRISYPLQTTMALEEMAEYEKTAPAITIETPHVKQQPVELLKIERTPRTINKFSLYSAIISIAAVIVLLIYIMFVPPAALQVATITDSVGAKWAVSENPTVIGDRLWDNEGVRWLQKGTVKIAFDYGAEVIIEGPAEFELENPEKMLLHSGRLYAVVPKGAAGFTVQTPYSTVIDLGTEFGVKVDFDGSTDVHMFKGKASIIPGETGNKADGLSLSAGQAKSVNTHGQMRNIAISQADFLAPAQFEVLSRADKGSGYHRWLLYSNQLRKDPSLVAYYTFDNQGQSPRKLLNIAETTQGRLDGILESDSLPEALPIWMKGRWQEKGALNFECQYQQFVSVAHDPILNLEKEMTLAAWVLIQDPKDGGTILAKSVSGTQQDGAPRKNYQMCYFDAEPFEGAGTANSLQFSASSTAEYVPVTAVYGQWMFLAAAYDAGAVRFYRDGRFIGAAQIDSPISFSTMPLLIGADYPYFGMITRYFEGIMDEVMIFNKALSPRQIQEIYINGKQ